MYRVFTTDEFDKRFSKLDPQLQREIGKHIDGLQANPHLGRPLGYPFFREKKVSTYRVYYLVYEQYVVVFVITISTKKDQQQAIDNVKALLPFYQEEIRKKLAQEPAP